jgi:GNAT superfamily N-acetyltransferase
MGGHKIIKYRKANIEDINELVRLRIEFMKEAMNIDNDQNDQVVRKALVEYFNRTMKDNNFIAWLAIDGSAIVGTSGLCFYTLPPSYKNISGDAAYIMNMYTQPLYRCRGIAASLFEKTVLEAKSMGYKKISLHATEMGKQVYKKFGFKEKDDEMVLDFT